MPVDHHELRISFADKALPRPQGLAHSRSSLSPVTMLTVWVSLNLSGKAAAPARPTSRAPAPWGSRASDCGNVVLEIPGRCTGLQCKQEVAS
jgi:hypothetical protein